MYMCVELDPQKYLIATLDDFIIKIENFLHTIPMESHQAHLLLRAFPSLVRLSKCTCFCFYLLQLGTGG